MAMNRESDAQLLGQVFRRYPEVEAVYLFGSSVAGQTHAESDLDLAIVPRHPHAARRKLDILADLARVGFCDVHLVFLDTDDIVLKYEAVRQNQLVYEGHGFDRVSFYSRVVRMYLDFSPYLEVQREAYRRRILSG